MSAAVLEAPPDEELWLPPAYRQVRPQTGLSSTHLLAGGGGDTLGLWEAGFLPLYAGNHEPVCIDSHIANWASLGTRHELADIANVAMCRGPVYLSNRAHISELVQQLRLVQHFKPGYPRKRSM